MKTDRELLELAAKAASYDIDWGDWLDCGSHTLYRNKAANKFWNPLNDDGDAFRLAVKLEIDLSFYTEREAKVYAQTKHLLGYGTDGGASYQAHEYHKELYKDSNQFSAVRRAIVRAAAEIGATK